MRYGVAALPGLRPIRNLYAPHHTFRFGPLTSGPYTQAMSPGSNVGVGCVLALCAAMAAHAQTPATSLEKTQQTQQFLDQRLSVWRERLKLLDWRISVAMTPRSDLAPKTLGGIRWDKPKKTAVIWVLDPSDYRLPFPAMLEDMELTIVHELLHLELASLPRSQASRGSEERAVNGIAEALLGLDRKKQ